MNVVEDSPEGGLEMKRNPVGRDEANHGNDDNESGVEPVDVLVDVLPGHRDVGDVDLVGVALGGTGSKRNIVLGAIREGLGLLARGGGRRHVDGCCPKRSLCVEDGDGKCRREESAQHTREPRGDGFSEE